MAIVIPTKESPAIRVPQTPINVIYMVVFTLGAIALVGTSALAGTMFYKNYADPVVLNSFLGIINFALGAMAGVLSNTRQNPEGNPSPNGNVKKETPIKKEPVLAKIRKRKR
jgi:hypothetical protein